MIQALLAKGVGFFFSDLLDRSKGVLTLNLYLTLKYLYRMETYCSVKVFSGPVNLSLARWWNIISASSYRWALIRGQCCDWWQWPWCHQSRHLPCYIPKKIFSWQKILWRLLSPQCGCLSLSLASTGQTDSVRHKCVKSWQHNHHQHGLFAPLSTAAH